MEEDSGASWDRVSSDYLKNFGVSVLRGRGFAAADNETSELVAVVKSSVCKALLQEQRRTAGPAFRH